MKPIVLVILLLGTHAVAQPQRDRTSVAKEFVDAANAAQKNGDYETAIDLNMKAYALTNNADVLFNIALAHRLAWQRHHGKDAAKAALHRDAAREYYRKFIATNPAEELELKARGWLDKLDAVWTEENPAEEAAKLEQARIEREAKIKAEQARLAAEREKREDEERRIAEAITKTARDSALGKARTVRVVGLGGVGLGAIAVGAGVYFGLKARRISNELESDDVFDQDKISDGNSAERFMAVSYASGAALLVASGITYWYGRRMAARAMERPLVDLRSQSGGAVVSVMGRF